MQDVNSVYVSTINLHIQMFQVEKSNVELHDLL